MLQRDNYFKVPIDNHNWDILSILWGEKAKSDTILSYNKQYFDYEIYVCNKYYVTVVVVFTFSFWNFLLNFFFFLIPWINSLKRRWTKFLIFYFRVDSYSATNSCMHRISLRYIYTNANLPFNEVNKSCFPYIVFRNSVDLGMTLNLYLVFSL